MASRSHQLSSPELASVSRTKKILQLKVKLKDFTPIIWRRLLISCTDTFEDLHNYIQEAMGWRSYHLHNFETSSGTSIEIEDEQDDSFGYNHPTLKESETRLWQFLNKPKDKVKYSYDFGDGWVHDVVVEKVLPVDETIAYPKCIGGKRACPPEDCGGTGGYEHLLDVFRNPTHAEYEELIVDWLYKYYPDFDPDQFNPKTCFEKF